MEFEPTIRGELFESAKSIYFNCVCNTFVSYVMFWPMLLGSLRKDDGNGNDDARKQWSDWLNEEKVIVLHVRHELKYNSLTWSAK